MKRFPLASIAAIVCSLTVAAVALAQPPGASRATAAGTSSASKTKWVAPIKGTAAIEVIQSTPKKVGKDMITTLKIRNASNGAIALLHVEEYWYDKGRNLVSGDTEFYKKQFLPGEIIEVTMKSPARPDLYTSQFKFLHANGAIKATAVKKFQ